MIFRVFAYYYNSAQIIWFLDGGFRSLLSSLMQSYELFPQFQFHLTRVGPYKMSHNVMSGKFTGTYVFLNWRHLIFFLIFQKREFFEHKILNQEHVMYHAKLAEFSHFRIPTTSGEPHWRCWPHSAINWTDVPRLLATHHSIKASTPGRGRLQQ